MVEHADLLNQAERGIKRQKIGQRPKPDIRRRLRHGPEEYSGDRHHVQRRRVMFGDVIAVKPQTVGGGDVFHPLCELLRKRAARFVDMIEYTEFHLSAPLEWDVASLLAEIRPAWNALAILRETPG